MATNELTVEVARRRPEIEALRPDWDRLLGRTARPTVFSGWEWTSSWYAATGWADPLAVAVHEGSRLVGLAPLRVRRRRLAGVVPYRVVEFAAAGVSEYLDVLAEAGREEEVLARVAGYFAGPGRGTWDVLRLGELPADSPALRALGSALESVRLRHLRRAGSVCPFLTLEGGWDGYLAGRSKHFRKKLGWTVRRARREFTVTCEEVTGREPLHRAFDRMAALHARQWGEASPLVRDPRSAAFHHRFIDLAAASGGPRIVELRFDGRLVAAQYWLLYGDTLAYYQGGRDPEFDRWSVGMILLHEVVAPAADAGVREVDLLRGGESYKYHWATDRRRNVDVEAWPRSVRGRLGELHRRLVRGAGTPEERGT